MLANLRHHHLLLWIGFAVVISLVFGCGIELKDRDDGDYRPPDGVSRVNAISVLYSNLQSGLSSSHVQGAMDEVVETLQVLENAIADFAHNLVNTSNPTCPSDMVELMPKVCVHRNLQNSRTEIAFDNAWNNCASQSRSKRLCSPYELLLACKKGLVTDFSTVPNRFEWSNELLYGYYSHPNATNEAVVMLGNNCDQSTLRTVAIPPLTGDVAEYRCCMDI